MNKQQVLDMRTDMKLLLECLDYQKDNPSAMRQALMTLASSLQSCGESKDEFRDCGGLKQVLELVTSTKHTELTEAGLFCLGSAVESNVYSQKLLSTASVFTYLHSVLSELRGGSVRKKQTASFLLLCLISNNGFGQHLMRQSSCLHDVISLIRITLPKNTRSHSEWFEGIDGISVELWSTLVSTACVCVNNPQNEENQRICSSLFSYLISLLQQHTDDRIVKPTLSLLGLTVSNNMQNQDRLRKCGGLDILVQQLETLQKALARDSKKLATVIQLLNTLDSCITDNETNSLRFGAQGGVKLAIGILSECPLNDHDKTQTVLTLAHAVDICRANQKFIKESDGMTVLIHQLTVTEDLELSKTIKYLLHICVSSDKHGVEESEEELSDTERKLSKAEQMKRHSELEILKKITELDSKLKTMEKDKKTTDELDISHDHDGEFAAELLSPQSAAQLPSMSRSTCGSYNPGDHACQTATPREQSLIDQLVQEKVERQRVELLNKMLQENMWMKNMLLSKETDKVPNTTNVEKQESFTSNLNTHESDRNNSATTRSGKNYTSTTATTQENNSREADHLAFRTRNRTSGQDGTEKEYQNSGPCDLRKNINRCGQSSSDANNINYKQTLEVTSQNTPLDLSAKATGIDQNNNEVLDLTKKMSSKNSCVPEKRNKPARHAEIQCGTPFVANIEDDTEEAPEERLIKTPNRSNDTDKLKPVIELSRGALSRSDTTYYNEAFRPNPNINVFKNFNSAALKTPVVVISDINRNKNLKKATTFVSKSKPPSTKKLDNQEEESPCGSNLDFDRVSRSSNDKFVKPTAIPPRSKVRVTPQLGTGISPGFPTFVKPTAPVASSPSNASICSEFDRDLICKLQNRKGVVIRSVPMAPPSVKPQKRTYVTPTIKSQNNTKKLDKLLENRRSATDSWNAVPSTPKYQGILPPRPAFSDCGMRRPLLDSPYSVNSVGKLYKPLDDSGFESPDLLRIVNSDTSSVDSNIEGFRSGSDPSDDEENEPVNITTAALRSETKPIRRSTRKRQKISSEKCPACQCPNKLGGSLLNSRTYNIVLETNPNTCTFHRELRKVERAHIQKEKKELNKNQNKSKMEKMIRKKPVLKKKSSRKKSVYDYASDTTEDYISPSEATDNENDAFLCLPQRAKLRRRRIPYSEEEEFNLMEGVRRHGKHWHTILLTYKFHPSRTNVDLKDKYKRVMASENKDASTMQGTSKGTLSVMPFSMCEERRLRRGVKKCGYNWKTILQSFTFAKGRTTEDLRNKWRALHRKQTKNN